MNILSIQSWVAYGHVGNASAVFPLQRLGAEVWALNTVQFSNHTGYGAWRGQVFGAELIRELVTGIEERGVLGTCDAVLSGYMGDAAIGEAILEAVARVRAANPQAVYCCDPVIGDVGRGVFVRPGIPEFMRDRAMPAADIATPNQFELEWLTGRAVGTLAEAKAAVRALQESGPRCVLVTSLRVEDTPADAIEMLAAEGGSSGGSARRCCRSRSMARAMPSRRCSCSTGCAGAMCGWRSPPPPPRSTGCCGGRPRRGRARS